MYDEARLQRAVAGAAPLRVLIVGGGPIGLRCAIELALLGLAVRVVEKRETFSRLNVLHLWDWVELDLIELGVKILDASVFASSSPFGSSAGVASAGAGASSSDILARFLTPRA